MCHRLDFLFRERHDVGLADLRSFEGQCVDSEQEALDFLYALQHCDPQFIQTVASVGEGKERELDAARSAAVWPDATDEDLTAPGLKERLEARLPKLMEEFKAAMEFLGFTY